MDSTSVRTTCPSFEMSSSSSSDSSTSSTAATPIWRAACASWGLASSGCEAGSREGPALPALELEQKAPVDVGSGRRGSADDPHLGPRDARAVVGVQDR